MTAAVEHLLDLGHRRIALINGHAIRPAVQRLAAFEDVFRNRDLGTPYMIREGSSSVETGTRAAEECLLDDDRPTAIIAGGNQLMIGALRVIAEHGLQLGKDLSFVGCDDIAITDLYRPPIAVVRRDNAELGKAAAELLIDLMKDDAAEDFDGERPERKVMEIMLPTEFLARESCGPRQARD